MASTTLQESVKQRAFELYMKRNGTDGNDQDDWFQAEKEIKSQSEKLQSTKRSNGR